MELFIDDQVGRKRDAVCAFARIDSAKRGLTASGLSGFARLRMKEPGD
jgi:hypothetical protein